MTSGNHEQYHNYTAYNNRFSMPENGKQNMFYSHDFGGIHLISINTEEKYDSLEPGSPQYLWIERDLQRAHANRANVPWIMIQGHRPMYNLIPGETSIRKHIEPLLMKYKVDLAVRNQKICQINFFFSILVIFIVIIVLILFLMEDHFKHLEIFTEIHKVLFI